uniref:Uncharacterized protein n=1 Tax=Cannabis sativa TaxID=3483 RepID=A0A803PMK5_CANSA
MTRIETVMTALTKGIPNVQTPPTTDDPRRVDPNDPRTSNPYKNKGKEIMGDTSQKTPTTKQQKKSKTVDQPQQKMKGNHALGKDKHHPNNSTSQSKDVDEVEREKGQRVDEATEKISRKQNTVSNFEEEDIEPCVKRIIDAPLSERSRMPQMKLYGGLTIGSLLWGDLQRKMAYTLTDFLTRAQGFINLEEAYAEAYGVLPTPSTNIAVAQTLQMTTPSIFLPATAFNTPTVYRLSASTQPASQASFSRFGVVQAGFSAAPRQMNQKVETLESNVSQSQSKRISKAPSQNDSAKKRKTQEYRYFGYTCLVDTRENVYKTTCNMVYCKKAPPMYKGERQKRDSNKRCDYHIDIGHTTSECDYLKDEIEGLGVVHPQAPGIQAPNAQTLQGTQNAPTERIDVAPSLRNPIFLEQPSLHYMVKWQPFLVDHTLPEASKMHRRGT